MQHRETIDDQVIRDAVRSLRTPLPRHLDQQVSATLKKMGADGARNTRKRWGLGVAMAASILLAVLMLVPGGDRDSGEQAAAQGRTIKTLFEIPGKKITIVWMQREDFFLPSIKGAKP